MYFFLTDTKNERTNDITVDGPLVAVAAAALETAAAALEVAPFAPEFDDIAVYDDDDDGCVNVDDDGGVNLKYLQQSHNFIVIACSVRSKSVEQTIGTKTHTHFQSE